MGPAMSSGPRLSDMSKSGVYRESSCGRGDGSDVMPSKACIASCSARLAASGCTPMFIPESSIGLANGLDRVVTPMLPCERLGNAPPVEREACADGAGCAAHLLGITERAVRCDRSPRIRTHGLRPGTGVPRRRFREAGSKWERAHRADSFCSPRFGFDSSPTNAHLTCEWR